MSSLELTSAPEFTPPRAGRWSRWTRPRWWYALKRQLWLDRFKVQIRVPWFVLLAALVPGAGFGRWWHKIMWPSIAVGLLLLAVGLIFIGRPPANIAFITLISLHVTSFLFALEPYLLGRQFWERIALSFGVMFCFVALFYQPGRRLVESYIVAPYIYQNRLVLMQPHAPTGLLKVGDLAVIEMREGRVGNVVVREGKNIGVVLGLPGDYIRFEKGVYFRNSQRSASLTHMPESGTIVLGKTQWLIWPSVNASGTHLASPEAISSVMLDRALVQKDEIRSRIYRRWFWWRQI